MLRSRRVPWCVLGARRLPERRSLHDVHGLASRMLRFVRWWFGLTYVAVGIGGVIAAPIMVAAGNWGGIYFLIGAPMLATLGWVIHPWGLQRLRRVA